MVGGWWRLVAISMVVGLLGQMINYAAITKSRNWGRFEFGPLVFL